MSARSRPPTDELKTEIFDSKNLRPNKPTQRGHDSGKPMTEADKEAYRKRAVELATPTEISPLKERSEPLRIISMKTPAELAAEKKQALGAKKHLVKLRALSELGPQQTPPMGYLAPPRDPKEVRARKVRDYVIWGCVVVIVSCAVMLGVWFLARR